jgi:hypothetical protein
MAREKPHTKSCRAQRGNRQGGLAERRRPEPRARRAELHKRRSTNGRSQRGSEHVEHGEDGANLRPPSEASGVDDTFWRMASRRDNPHGGSCVCAKLSRPTAKGPDAAAERQGQRPARKASGPGRRRSTVALGWPERRGDEEMSVSYSADRHGPKARPRQGYSPEGQRQAKRRLCS